MARAYRVIDVTPKPPARETSYVTAQDIEDELNRQAQDGWELFTMFEHFLEGNRLTGMAGMEQYHFSIRVSVTLVFHKALP